MAGKPRRVAVMLDLRWPYKRHAGIFAGSQQYAKQQEWHSIIDEFAHDTLPARRGKSVPYDGIIARANQPLAARAGRLGVPVVNVWASSPARDRLPGVFPDYTVAGRLCAEHLLARGFRNFATLTPPRNVAQDLVVKEFARLVGEAGFSCAQEKVPQDPERDLAHWRKTEQMIERWMDAWRRPIGVYISSEGLGRMVVQACHRRGWHVPADIAVIAGQNEETVCEHPRPSLTSMELGYERIGYEAARLLDRLMDGKTPPKEPILLLPLSLVVRESTDFFTVDDKLVTSALEFSVSEMRGRRDGSWPAVGRRSASVEANQPSWSTSFGCNLLERRFSRWIAS